MFCNIDHFTLISNIKMRECLRRRNKSIEFIHLKTIIRISFSAVNYVPPPCFDYRTHSYNFCFMFCSKTTFDSRAIERVWCVNTPTIGYRMKVQRNLCVVLCVHLEKYFGRSWCLTKFLAITSCLLSTPTSPAVNVRQAVAYKNRVVCISTI